MSIGTPRRYFLLKTFAARDQRDGLEEVWRAKQQEVEGTALPSDFPFRTKLATAGYSTVEDLTGATTDELEQRASLRRREAAAALAALETT